MNRHDFEKLGNLHKSYEVLTDTKLMPGLPIMIRLDGRAFHTFTKGLKRPYDEGMSRSMIETAKFLVHHLNADISFTQSDEISLGFKNDILDESTLFSSRIQKLCW